VAGMSAPVGSNGSSGDRATSCHPVIITGR